MQDLERKRQQAALGVSPFLNWVGGKEKLQRIICSTFPQNIRRYAEHFGGSGALLLGRKKQRGVIEVYNDYDGDLVNLFCCVKRRIVELTEELGFFPLHSEEEFHLFRDVLDHTISEPDFTDREIAAVERNFEGREKDELIQILKDKAELWNVRRAAAYYLINRGCFSGAMRSFGVKPVRFRNLIEDLEYASLRLEGVPILHRDCVSSIRLNDKPGTLHYCDPPYFEAERMYDVPFGKPDHERFHDAARQSIGHMVISYNYCGYVCDLFSDFYILKFERKNEMAQRKGAKYAEVIITNYDPRPMIEMNQSQLSMFGPPDVEQEDASLLLINKPSRPTRHERPGIWLP